MRPPTIVGLLLASISVLLAAPGRAATFEIAGHRIELAAPSGFCALGDSAREREQVLRNQRAAMGAVLAHYSVPCDELARFKAGKLDRFTRWAMVHLPAPDGRPWIIKVKRDDFLKEHAGELANRPVDIDALNQGLHDHLAKQGVAVSIQSVQPLGLKSPAFYASIKGDNNTLGIRVQTIGIIALTVIDGVVLTATVYSHADLKDEQQMGRAVAFVENIVALNE